jgi:hypothetical protein
LCELNVALYRTGRFRLEEGMMAEDFCVFVSGVSSEFGKAREAIAAALRTRGMVVKEQKDFRAEPLSPTTLKLLHDYIAICDAVVYIIGERSGAKPSHEEAAEFVSMLPPGIREATYTQWEFYFALRFDRPMFAYVANPAYAPDKTVLTGEDQDHRELHKAFRNYIFNRLGRYRLGFNSAEELCDHVERADWDSLLITKGWSQEKFFISFLKDRSHFFFGRDWLFGDISKWRGEGGHGERMMLVTGTPGIGKSSVVARFLNQAPSGKILSYHCFMHTQKETTQLDGFVRNIACQLAHNLRSYREVLVRPEMRRFVQELDSSDEEGPGNFFRNAIFGVLHDLKRPVDLDDGPAWIVVDALDEAVDREDPEYDTKRQNFYRLIEAALELLPPWLRVLATSRRDDLTERLGLLFENGRPLVHQIYLDDEKRPEDANMYRDYIAARLSERGLQLPESDSSRIIKQSEGNFLYLRLVLDDIAVTNTVEEVKALIKALPRGLPRIYTQYFERLYPVADLVELQNEVRPILAALAVARTPLAFECLARVTALPDRRLRHVLGRLKAYLPPSHDKYSIFHKSFADWLLDPKTPPRYAIDPVDGHKLLAAYCWSSLDALQADAVDVTDLEGDSDWDYLMRYGIGHMLEAGAIARAVRLLNFIETKWDEESVSDSSFKDIAPRVFTRLTLRALDDCPAEEKPKIDANALAPLLRDFYQVEPLGPPIEILIRYHGQEWKKSILQEFMDAGNYVLRFSISEVLADVLLETLGRMGGTRDAPVTLDEVYGYLNHPDINFRELGAYTVRHLYGREPRLIEHEYIERMADSDTYAGRSALGDLLLNLVFQKRFDIAAVNSSLFWEPIWDHNRIDVWDLKAAVPFLAGASNPPDGADAGTKVAFANFRRTAKMQQDLLDESAIKALAGIYRLVKDFFKLGGKPKRISRAQKQLEDSPHLTQLMRLFFSHPLWNVAEVAASVLQAMIQKDPGRQAIVFELFDDPYWRVRFGAIETAYQHAEMDRNALFGAAVKRFHSDANSRVRALCAENLIAYILERPAIRRKQLLAEFREAIDAWIKDDDAWVLEHVFRLLTKLAAEDVDTLLPTPMPYLLDGLGDWSKLSREKFLTHIEGRKRQSSSLSPAAAAAAPR